MYHIRQMEKHKALAIAKGAKISVDTVYKDRDLTFNAPAFSDSSSINTAVDSSLFWTVMQSYDSLLREYYKLKDAGVSGEREVAVVHSLDEKRRQVAKGFLKDSVYHIKFNDSVTVDLAIVQNQPRLLKIDVPEKTVKVTRHIPIAINEQTKAGYGIGQLLLVAFVGLAVGIGGMAVLIWRKQRQEQPNQT